MYDPIFAKSFSHYERKRFSCCAFLLCFIVALTICSTFKPHLQPPSMTDDDVNVELATDTIHDIPEINGTSESSQLPLARKDANLQLSVAYPVQNMVTNESSEISKQPIAAETKKVEPVCSIIKPLADYCEMEGDIRVQANSSTIYIITPHASNQSWSIKPYPKKWNLGAMNYVKNWTVVSKTEDENTPKCSVNHSIPAILFSIGGYSGNHFHDFADLVIPLFSTSMHFKGDVHFLTTDYKPWWIGKFQGLLSKLSRQPILAIEKESQIHCYGKFIAGLRSQEEMIMDPSISPDKLSMFNFRQFLRSTYSLERRRAILFKKHDSVRPRLLIISRRRTRIITNEVEISQLARKMGYEVVIAEGEASSNLTRFAQIVNSCDVLMGIHGAGLTNMVFLPDNAVLIQVIPLGNIDGFAKSDFGKPAPGMNIRYLEYKIEVKESSLSQQYPLDHQVIRDPLFFHRKGWEALRSTYLDNQNVTISARRFKATLAKALKLLHR